MRVTSFHCCFIHCTCFIHSSILAANSAQGRSTHSGRSGHGRTSFLLLHDLHRIMQLNSHPSTWISHTVWGCRSRSFHSGQSSHAWVRYVGGVVLLKVRVRARNAVWLITYLSLCFGDSSLTVKINNFLVCAIISVAP